MKETGSLGSPLNSDLVLYIDYEDNQEEILERIISITQNKMLSEMICEIHSRLFKGRFYSNKYNFAKIVNIMEISSYDYNKYIKELIQYQIIEEVGERVYRFCKGVEVHGSRKGVQLNNK